MFPINDQFSVKCPWSFIREFTVTKNWNFEFFKQDCTKGYIY